MMFSLFCRLLLVVCQLRVDVFVLFGGLCVARCLLLVVVVNGVLCVCRCLLCGDSCCAVCCCLLLFCLLLVWRVLSVVVDGRMLNLVSGFGILCVGSCSLFVVYCVLFIVCCSILIVYCLLFAMGCFDLVCVVVRCLLRVVD